MCRAHVCHTLSSKEQKLKSLLPVWQMIGGAVRRKPCGGITNVRSRALSSCAFAQNMHTLLSQLKCVALDPDCCVRQEFLSRNLQLFVDFYLQIWLTKQRLSCILSTLEKKLTAQRFLVRCLISWGWCFSLSFITHFSNPSWIKPTTLCK